MQIVIAILIIILVLVSIVVAFYALALLVLPALFGVLLFPLLLRLWCRSLLRESETTRARIALSTSGTFSWEYRDAVVPYPDFPICLVACALLVGVVVELCAAYASNPDPVFTQKLGAGLALIGAVGGPYYVASKFRERVLSTVRTVLAQSINDDLRVDPHVLQQVVGMEHEYVDLCASIGVNPGRSFVEQCRDMLISAKNQRVASGQAAQSILEQLTYDLGMLKKTHTLYVTANDEVARAGDRAIDLNSRSLLMQIDDLRAVLESDALGILIERREWQKVTDAISNVTSASQRLSSMPGVEGERSGADGSARQWEIPSSAAEAYEVLGVADDMTLAQITDVYRTLIQRWHPDATPDPAKKENRERRTTILNIAMEKIRADKAGAAPA